MTTHAALIALALLTLSIVLPRGRAATGTLTLSVPDMDCAACPITVDKALTKVSGVGITEVSLDRRKATVIFDAARMDVEALERATRNVAYPPTVVGSAR